MSRIVGLVTSADGAQLESAVKQMMQVICSGNARQRSIALSGHACLGACDWRQPSMFELDKVTVVMDGNIFNNENSSRPDAHFFASSYRQYGFASTLERINGDFAVALFDTRTNELWLARDRFGIKPLYYVSNSECFAFASRPSALLILPDVNRDVNHRFVALFAGSHYRYFDNNPSQSPYSGIAQLPAAHMLHLKDGKLTKTAFWSLEDLPDYTESDDELAERYRELLMDAVSLRLRSARRPAFTLSGGMDSSSVLASAVKMSGAKQHAFSTVYSDKTYDESNEICSMLEGAVKKWHQIPIGTPDVFSLIRRMIAVHDEPVATATWLSHFLLCEEAARKGFGSLFGGLGGDELNAGEYEYFIYHFADLRVTGAQDKLKREIQMWVQYHDHPIFRKSFEAVEKGFGRLVDLSQPGRCRPDRYRVDRYAQALNRDFFDLQDFEPIMDHPFRSYLKNRTYQDITRETAPCCLRAEDRQTAAFDLDNFLPFLDHRLVEFMFRIPGTMKFHEGLTKHLLRKAMVGVLPEETRTRVKKTGWNAPAHVWFSGSNRDRLLDMVHSKTFRERGIYNVSEVKRLIDEHDKIVATGKPQENHMMFLWQLVNLELWLQAIPEIGRQY